MCVDWGKERTVVYHEQTRGVDLSLAPLVPLFPLYYSAISVWQHSIRLFSSFVGDNDSQYPGPDYVLLLLHTLYAHKHHKKWKHFTSRIALYNFMQAATKYSLVSQA